MLTRAWRVDEDFFSLTEATVRSLDGKETTMQFACINKTQVLFVGESGDGEARGFRAEAGHELGTVLEKTPAIVKVFVPPYTLTGEMHCTKGQRLSDVLNTGEMFLPLTNVKTLPSMATGESHMDFVAINKTHIFYLEEV
ncbi:hypothetical protein ACFLXT_03775 [Chloroflexota bacterium]